MQEIKVLSGSTSSELDRRENFHKLFKESPLPQNELLSNLGLYTSRQTLSRILFMHELYQKIVSVHGVIMEFGVRWGQNLALYQSFRGMYEPFNYNRKLIGFDTFEGFPSVDKKDGSSVNVGDYSVTKNYVDYLKAILDYHEAESPLAHMKKYSLEVGDASVTIVDFLKRHPETIVSLAYFDFDIYKPTKDCLEAILPHLTKGSILAFDELNFDKFPGETLALREVIGLSKYRIQRSPLNPLCSYLIVE
jgi:hypothetical protein